MNILLENNPEKAAFQCFFRCSEIIKKEGTEEALRFLCAVIPENCFAALITFRNVKRVFTKEQETLFYAPLTRYLYRGHLSKDTRSIQLAYRTVTALYQRNNKALIQILKKVPEVLYSAKDMQLYQTACRELLHSDYFTGEHIAAYFYYRYLNSPLKISMPEILAYNYTHSISVPVPYPLSALIKKAAENGHFEYLERLTVIFPSISLKLLEVSLEDFPFRGYQSKKNVLNYAAFTYRLFIRDALKEQESARLVSVWHDAVAKEIKDVREDALDLLDFYTCCAAVSMEKAETKQYIDAYTYRPVDEEALQLRPVIDITEEAFANLLFTRFELTRTFIDTLQENNVFRFNADRDVPYSTYMPFEKCDVAIQKMRKAHFTPQNICTIYFNSTLRSVYPLPLVLRETLLRKVTPRNGYKVNLENIIPYTFHGKIIYSEWRHEYRISPLNFLANHTLIRVKDAEAHADELRTLKDEGTIIRFRLTKAVYDDRVASGLYLIGDVLYEEGASENLTLFRRQYKNRTLSSKEFLELLSHEDSPIGKLRIVFELLGKQDITVRQFIGSLKHIIVPQALSFEDQLELQKLILTSYRDLRISPTLFHQAVSILGYNHMPYAASNSLSEIHFRKLKEWYNTEENKQELPDIYREIMAGNILSEDRYFIYFNSVLRYMIPFSEGIRTIVTHPGELFTIKGCFLSGTIINYTLKEDNAGVLFEVEHTVLPDTTVVFETDFVPPSLPDRKHLPFHMIFEAHAYDFVHDRVLARKGFIPLPKLDAEEPEES